VADAIGAQCESVLEIERRKMDEELGKRENDLVPSCT